MIYLLGLTLANSKSILSIFFVCGLNSSCLSVTLVNVFDEKTASKKLKGKFKNELQIEGEKDNYEVEFKNSDTKKWLRTSS